MDRDVTEQFKQLTKAIMQIDGKVEAVIALLATLPNIQEADPAKAEAILSKTMAPSIDSTSKSEATKTIKRIQEIVKALPQF